MCVHVWVEHTEMWNEGDSKRKRLIPHPSCDLKQLDFYFLVLSFKHNGTLGGQALMLAQ